MKIVTPNPPIWLRAMCSGSTTDARSLTIVAEGKHLAVIRYPGETYWAGTLRGRSYHSTYLKCVQKDPPQSHMRHVSELQDLEGRQSKVAIDVFCTAMFALDSRWEDREAKRIAKERAKDEAREAKYREEEAQAKRDALWLKHRAKVVATLVAAREYAWNPADGPASINDLICAVLKKTGHDYGDGKPLVKDPTKNPEAAP